MFFLLRCTFWLGLVYCAMFWPQASLSGGAALVSAAVTQSKAAMTDAATKIALEAVDAQIKGKPMPGPGEMIEKAVSSYVTGTDGPSGKASTGTAAQPADPHAARVWCTKSDAICAHDAARLEALIDGGPSIDAPMDNAETMLPLPQRRPVPRALRSGAKG